MTTLLDSLLRTNQTVFTSKELRLLWNENDPLLVNDRINYYVTSGALYPIRKGLYGKDANYDRLEMAVRIFTPAYISFETVLGSAGVTFQYCSQLFVATYLTRNLKVDGQELEFRKLKDRILFSTDGIDNVGNYAVASPERAFLDTVYLNKEYHFDNLSLLNWDKVLSLLQIYQNKSMEARVSVYYRSAQRN